MAVEEKDRLALYDEMRRVLSERGAGTLLAMLSEVARADDFATKKDLAELEARLTDRMRVQTLTIAATLATSVIGGMALAAAVS